MFKIDNNGEHYLWEFGDFLKTQGIVHQTLIPYTSQQNDFVERINHTIIKGVHCIMHQQPKLSSKFWVEIINIVINIKAWNPQKYFNLKTPNEVWGKKKPSIIHLCVFGCNTYIHRPIETRLKLGPNFTRCVFVGCNLESKGYKLIVPKTRKLIVS